MTDQHGKPGPVAAAMARAAREQPSPDVSDASGAGAPAPSADDTASAGTYQSAADRSDRTAAPAGGKRPASVASSAAGAPAAGTGGVAADVSQKRPVGAHPGRPASQAPGSVANPNPPFSVTKLLAGVIQSLALLALFLVFRAMVAGADPLRPIIWGVVAVMAQTMALTFFVMQRSEPMR